MKICYDTETEVTIISAGLFGSTFLTFLQFDIQKQLRRVKSNPVNDLTKAQFNEPYKTSLGFVQVAINICFTNEVLEMKTASVMRPMNIMSNGFTRGQKGGIECLDIKMTPRNFLPRPTEQFWGEIHISRSFDHMTEKFIEH